MQPQTQQGENSTDHAKNKTGSKSAKWNRTSDLHEKKRRLGETKSNDKERKAWGETMEDRMRTQDITMPEEGDNSDQKKQLGEKKRVQRDAEYRIEGGGGM